MARQRPARWIAGPSERTMGNWGDLTDRFRHHNRPEAAIRGPLVRTGSWRSPGWVCGREQGRYKPLGSCADSRLCIIIFNPSTHGGRNRPSGRTALAGGF